MPSSGASAAPGAPEEEPSRDRCIALYAWFFPISSPSPPSPASPDWNPEGRGRGGEWGTRSAAVECPAVVWRSPSLCVSGLVARASAVSYDSG